jgi:heat shock protein HslJ
MKSKITFIAMLAVIAAISTSAQTAGPPFGWRANVTSQNQSSDLCGTSWQLIKFQSSDDTTSTPDDKTKYTVTFVTDGSVTARIDCNRGRGIWKSSGPNQIQFGPLALTRAMCPPGSLHDQIAKNWTLVRSYIIKDGHLFLSLMADGGIYEFEPMSSPVSLAGTRWHLTEVNGLSLQSSKAYIEFDDKTNRFFGHGGCNRISGRYSVDGSHIKFYEIISTQMACIDNEVQKAETEFLKQLNAATDFQIQGNILRLYTGEQPTLVFSAETTDTTVSPQNSQ